MSELEQRMEAQECKLMDLELGLEQIDGVVQRQQSMIDELRGELDRLRQQLVQLMEDRES